MKLLPRTASEAPFPSSQHTAGAALAAIPRSLLVWFFAPRGAPGAVLWPWAKSAAIVIAALLVALLAGCATPLPVAQTASLITGTAPTPRSHFSLSGRFSAKTSAEQVSGQFRYTQTESLRTLNLFSPLGTPVADIVATRDAATLTQASGNSQSAASLADLLRTVIDLPVTDAMMSAWLQGLPSAPDVVLVTAVERDGAGLPMRFVESGWEIQISARMESNPRAPRRMRWSLIGQPDTEVRWAIDEWSAP